MAPIDKDSVKNILDVGCGPGTWTMVCQIGLVVVIFNSTQFKLITK